MEERVTIARFAKQWQNRGIASSFRKWNHYAKYRIRKRKITARVVRLYEQKFFKSHMKHWRLQSIVERGNRLDKERIEKNTQTFIRKWKNMEIHNCMVRRKRLPVPIQASLDGVSITGGILVCAEYFLGIGHYVLTDLRLGCPLPRVHAYDLHLRIGGVAGAKFWSIYALASSGADSAQLLLHEFCERQSFVVCSTQRQSSPGH